MTEIFISCGAKCIIHKNKKQMNLKPNVVCVGILQIFQSIVGIRPVFARLRRSAVEIFRVKNVNTCIRGRLCILLVVILL